MTLGFVGTFSAGAQTMEFSWLGIPSGTYSLGMAGTGYLSDENVAWSSFGSSAMAALSDRRLAAAMSYSRWQPSPFNRVSAGVSGKAGSGVAVSGGASFLGGRRYSVFDSGGQRTGDYMPYMLEMNLGTGGKLTDFMSVGAGFVYAMEAVTEDRKYNALAGNLMMAFIHHGFRGCVGVSSFGASLGSDGGLKSFPASAKITAGYEDSLYNGKFHLSAYTDADCYLNGSVSAAIGASVGYRELITFRGGYRYSSSTAPLPSFGTLGISVGYAGIALDLAYVLSSDQIRNSFQTGLRYSF